MSLMISISGVRGIVGETMSPMLAAELGLAFGSYLHGATVVVGRDTRPSGQMIQRAVVSGLLAAGCEVINLGIVTTPGVGVMILRHGAAGGIVITASHNPIEWNGIKFLTSGGYAPPPEQSKAILEHFYTRTFTLARAESMRPERYDASTHEQHIASVLSRIDVDQVRERRYRVVLDSVNGAGGIGGRTLLENLGCEVIPINGDPTGRFAHPPEPLAENLTQLRDAVRKHRADFGFAQDPDADRLAIVDETGRYIGEEYTLALAVKRVLQRLRGPVAANLSTSRMIDDLASAVGDPARVIRTPVGEAHVAAAMREHKCVIGGEGNGGVILPEVVLVRDSFVAMALVLELTAPANKRLSAVVDELPRYAMIKRRLEIDPVQIDGWFGRIRRNARDGRINDADGLRVDWPNGWVHVRPSNTEPIVRLIAEADDEQTADRLARRITDLLK
jgi:phosphomannomutase